MYSSLRKVLKDKYDIKIVSNAWTKMYEILCGFKLFDTNKQTLNTFHICEAPGSFISAFQYFIKNKTNVKNYNWHAQSLNPNHPENIQKYGKNIFTDDYGLMKNNKDRWLFNGTGDLTNVDVIKSYKLKDLDIITSDCGIGVNNYNKTEEEHAKINLGQILTIMYLLPKGKNCVIKCFLPMVEPANVSWLYLMYSSFDRVVYCKPITSRPASREIYIIGLGFSGVDVMPYFKYLENFENKSFVEEYPTEFLTQLYTINNTFIDASLNYLERIFYYYDNVPDMDKTIHLKNWLKNI